MLYRIKNAGKLPAQDLRQIARFNRIIKNYLKMCRIEQREDNATKPESHGK